MTPHKCPVCNGSGQVPNGLYHPLKGYWSGTSITPEQCRSCGGTGVVWEDVKDIKRSGYFVIGEDGVSLLDEIEKKLANPKIWMGKFYGDDDYDTC